MLLCCLLYCYFIAYVIAITIAITVDIAITVAITIAITAKIAKLKPYRALDMSKCVECCEELESGGGNSYKLPKTSDLL